MITMPSYTYMYIFGRTLRSFKYIYMRCSNLYAIVKIFGCALVSEYFKKLASMKEKINIAANRYVSCK